MTKSLQKITNNIKTGKSIARVIHDRIIKRESKIKTQGLNSSPFSHKIKRN